MFKHWNELPDILTAPVVAEFLNLSLDEVYRKARSGDFVLTINETIMRQDHENEVV